MCRVQLLKKEHPMKREEVSELVERGIRELNEALAAGKSDRLQQYLGWSTRRRRAKSWVL
jgi:hypothetical protein